MSAHTSTARKPTTPPKVTVRTSIRYSINHDHEFNPIMWLIYYIDDRVRESKAIQAAMPCACERCRRGAPRQLSRAQQVKARVTGKPVPEPEHPEFATEGHLNTPPSEQSPLAPLTSANPISRIMNIILLAQIIFIGDDEEKADKPRRPRKRSAATTPSLTERMGHHIRRLSLTPASSHKHRRT
ncbi:hypothetical protein HWV62_11099 [Athelia sp. TMB]|nr:hypothetical protein HWV62_11099 [Athelia sp. TMB]